MGIFEIILSLIGVVGAGLLLVAVVVIGLAPFLLPVIMWIFFIRLIVNSARRSSNHKYFKNNVVVRDYPSNSQKNIYVDVSIEKLKQFHTEDLDSLKNYFYDIFFQFETAYNNLDYYVMKSLSTKQLFQNYYTGIRLDLEVGKKRIIEQIVRRKVIIYELDSTSIKQTLSTMIEISYVNYTINKNGDVISGSRNHPVTEKFEVTFRKDYDKSDSSKCPNCGASLKSNQCEYCKTLIMDPEFKISNIKKIAEK